MPKTYPSVITPEMLANLAHISDDEIRKDIADTEREITQLAQVAKAEEQLAKHHPVDYERRMADFRANGRGAQIDERERFNAFLALILSARNGESVNDAVSGTETGRFLATAPNMTSEPREEIAS